MESTDTSIPKPELSQEFKDEWMVISPWMVVSSWPKVDPVKPIEYVFDNGAVWSLVTLTNGSKVRNWIANAQSYNEAQLIISCVTELPRP